MDNTNNWYGHFGGVGNANAVYGYQFAGYKFGNAYGCLDYSISQCSFGGANFRGWSGTHLSSADDG